MFVKNQDNGVTALIPTYIRPRTITLTSELVTLAPGMHQKRRFAPFIRSLKQ